MLAPFFCMGYFYASKKTKIVAYALTFGIIILIVLVKFLEQPWRGIVDFGVVLGLSYGLISFLICAAKSLFAPSFSEAPEVPER